MFVKKSTYEAMRARALAAEAAFRYRNNEWNQLVQRINAKGGQQFLTHATLSPAAPQFSADDIQRLLQLVHPDKHDGKPMANEMTAKLLKLKESVRP